MKNCPRTNRKVYSVLMLVFTATVLWPLTALADEVCIRGFASAAAIDGVVAPGEATASCSADTLWPQVAPVHLHPTGSQVETYMYIARISGTQKLRIGIDTAGDPDVSDFDTILLFFDANNDGAWDNTDFAVRIRVRPENFTVTDSGEDCDLQSGTVQYYQRSGGGWESIPDAADDITVRYAYDYAAPDVEDQIWNIEMDIPTNGSSPYQINTSGPDYFAIGAFVFADQGQLPEPDPNGQVRVWPNGLESDTLGAPPQIAQYNSTLAILEPNPATLGDINLEAVCYDVTFPNAGDFWIVNGNPANNYDEFIRRNAENDFRVYYTFNGPIDEGELREPNRGTVRLGIKPYNGGGSLANSYWSKTEDVAFSTFGEHPVDYTFDLRNAPDPDFNSPDATFICAHAWLENFEMNDITSNDEEHMNLNYFSTSEATLTMRLHGSELPKRKSGEIRKIYLKFQMTNEHPKLRKDRAGVIPVNGGSNGGPTGLYAALNWFTGSTLFSVSWWLQLLSGLALVTLSWVLMRRTAIQRWAMNMAALGGIVLLIGPILVACNGKIIRPDKPTKPAVGGARWQVVDAKKAGLRAVKGKPGLYTMSLNRDQMKKLDLKFVGQPLPYKMKNYRLRAAVEGRPNKIDIRVKPGTALTMLAKGNVDVDGKEGPLPIATPAGFTRKMPRNLRKARSRNIRPQFFSVRQKVIGKRFPLADRRKRHLLTEGYYRPNEYTGALIGSFDGFKTSFVVGRHKTILVPPNTQTFSLAVNAMAEDYATMVGLYNVGVIVTEAPKVPTRTIGRGDATYHVPPTLPPWQALTTLNVYTFIDDPLVVQGKVLKTMRPWGHARFTIYDSHVTQFTN